MPVAIITGASSGIGRATALLFASKGYALSLSGRNEDALKEVAALCLGDGEEKNVIYTVGDLTNRETLESIVKATLDAFSTIDVLVNNAGILLTGPVTESPIDDFDRVFDTNVRSVIQLTRLAAPHVIAAKGTFVNWAAVPYYCMSKAALDQFTKCLALEMAPYGVRVNAVNPAVIATAIHMRAGQDEETYSKFLENGKKTHALGRVGEADEVAKAILFLASSDSSFTTGETLRVDGGRGIMYPVEAVFEQSS